MDKNMIINFLRKDGKKLKADLVAVFVTGIMLIILGNAFWGNGKATPAKKTIVQTSKSETKEAQSYDDLENRLSKVFASIEGVGKVEVMVTLKTGNEIIIAEDERTSDGKETTNIEKSAVILSQSGGNEQPLVLKEKYPEIEGIVIVAEGGDDIFVKEALSKGAQALLNVPAHKVEIFKMGK